MTDDPDVEDEASTHPSVVPSKDGGHDTELNFEVEKTITDRLSIGINDGYSILDRLRNKRSVGWPNLNTTLKYQIIDDDEHEFVSSVGVIREWGGTGRASIGADAHGSTTPTFYFGKGLGDLPIGDFRPLAVTGTFGYQVPDAPEESPRQLAIGLSLQYSIPYLQKHKQGLERPDFVARLTPIVELAYTVPTTHGGNVSTRGTISPGIIYTGDSYQLGIEALIPATQTTGHGVGVIAQFHVFFSDIIPQTLGKPLF